MQPIRVDIPSAKPPFPRDSSFADNAIDIDLVRHFTGQDRILSVEQANRELAEADARLANAAAPYQQAKMRCEGATASLNQAKATLRFAQWQLRSKLDPVLVVIFVIAPFSLMLGVGSVLLRFSPVTTTIFALSPFLLLLILIGASPRDIPKWKAQVQSLERLLPSLRAAAQEHEPAFTSATAAREATKRVRDGLVRANESVIGDLLRQAARLLEDSAVMDGGEFESFLAEVFRHLGFQVERTGRTGDQGVDLIVRRGKCIAVQAKCYSGSVGNAAVQEVFAGQAHCKCDSCAVITSSVFTRQARDLAASTGCLLIEGNQLADLILEKINL